MDLSVRNEGCAGLLYGRKAVWSCMCGRKGVWICL